MAGAGMVAGASCTTHDEASQMQQSLESAHAALQSSSENILISSCIMGPKLARDTDFTICTFHLCATTQAYPHSSLAQRCYLT